MRFPTLIFLVVAAGLSSEPASAQYDGDDDALDSAPVYAPIDEPFNETADDVDDITIAERVGDELDRALGDDAESIQIRVVDGNVYLTGYVESERARRLVHDAVWTVAGVRELRIDGLYASTYFKSDRY